MDETVITIKHDKNIKFKVANESTLDKKGTTEKDIEKKETAEKKGTTGKDIEKKETAEKKEIKFVDENVRKVHDRVEAWIVDYLKKETKKFSTKVFEHIQDGRFVFDIDCSNNKDFICKFFKKLYPQFTFTPKVDIHGHFVRVDLNYSAEDCLKLMKGISKNSSKVLPSSQ